MKKYCSFHNAYHDVTAFGKNKSRPDGLHQYCKMARKEMNKKRYDKNFKIDVNEVNKNKNKITKEVRDYIHYSNYLKASLDDGCLHWRRLWK
jgi:hypothetical protein